jgi:hypothetical protein
MATLVLTTVGGAIGGPIGAALGAVVGQRIDGALLAPRGRQGPRLSELKVQTSSYGTQVPMIFGRMRVAGCVIWAADLIEQRGTTRGGKGQGSVTSYSYAASFAVALSARRIAGVGRIWADGKLLRGAAGDWKTQTGFRLYLGDEEQGPDPLIASAVGTGVAPAHRGVAYAVFEQLQLADFGNRIPSLTFEVIADAAAVRVGDVARAIGDGALVGDGPELRVHGFAASGDTIAAAAGVLAALSGGWFAAAGEGVTLSDHTGEPVEIAARTLSRTRAPADRVPVRVEVAHYDPARDYQIGVQHASRGGGVGRAEEVPIAAAMPADAAKAVALSTLLARERMRETRRVVADARAIAVAPGDAVRLGGDPRAWRVVRSDVEAMRVTLDLVPLVERVASRPADAGAVIATPDVVIGRTIVEAFELYPDGEEAWSAPRIAIAAAGDGAGRRGDGDQPRRWRKLGDAWPHCSADGDRTRDRASRVRQCDAARPRERDRGGADRRRGDGAERRRRRARPRREPGAAGRRGDPLRACRAGRAGAVAPVGAGARAERQCGVVARHRRAVRAADARLAAGSRRRHGATRRPGAGERARRRRRRCAGRGGDDSDRAVGRAAHPGSRVLDRARRRQRAGDVDQAQPARLALG